jgi:hypothetical protein
MTAHCDAYGAESLRPTQNLGGFDKQPVAVQWICTERPAHRFRFICEHGHKGRIVGLCETHWAEFSGQKWVPATLRRDITFCPTCNTYDDHKCKVELVTVSL